MSRITEEQKDLWCRIGVAFLLIAILMGWNLCCGDEMKPVADYRNVEYIRYKIDKIDKRLDKLEEKKDEEDNTIVICGYCYNHLKPDNKCVCR